MLEMPTIEEIQRWATAIQINGVDSRFLSAEQIKKRLPSINIGSLDNGHELATVSC